MPTREEIIGRFNDLRADLMAAIDGLSPAQLSERPDDGWSIKDQLFHIAAWDTIRAAEVARISAGHATSWRMTGEQDAALNAIFYELHHDLTLEQAMWELSASRERLLAELARATERGPDPALYGEAGLMTGHETQHAAQIGEWREKMGY
jgi:hypothetical protein